MNKIFNLYSFANFDNKDGKDYECYKKVSPFFFSNKIPIRFMQISAFENKFLIFFHHKY